MALIAINEVDMPTPSSYSWGIMDLSKAERNALGTLIIERIATKRKIELGWAYLTPEQLQTLLTAVGAVTFSLSYLDAQTNTTLTGTFYSGDRNVGMIDFNDGVPRYKDVKFNLIEK